MDDFGGGTIKTLPFFNNFESGLADETILTEANSSNQAAGTGFYAIFAGGTGHIKVDTARAAHGTRSVRFDQDTTNGIEMEWDWGSLYYTELWGRLYIYRTATPTPDPQWFVVWGDGVNPGGIIRCETDGNLGVWDSTFSVFDESSVTIPLNEWVRIEWYIKSHSTRGVVEAKMYHQDQTTVIDTARIENVNTLTEIAGISFGQWAALATGSSWWLDDIRVSNEGWLGPAGDDPSVVKGPYGTPLLDNFNRADNPDIDGTYNWKKLEGNAATQIINQHLEEGNSPPASGTVYWKTPVGVNCEAWCRINARASTDEVIVNVRINSINVSGNSNSYELSFNGNGDMHIGRRDAGVYTQLGNQTVDWQPGDYFALTAINNQISAWRNRNCNGWEKMFTEVDNTYITNGYISMSFFTNAGNGDLQWDDFGGGTIGSVDPITKAHGAFRTRGG